MLHNGLCLPTSLLCPSPLPPPPPQVIKRFILHAKKTAFIVEHDFIMATYLADRVIVYEVGACGEGTSKYRCIIRRLCFVCALRK